MICGFQKIWPNENYCEDEGGKKCLEGHFLGVQQTAPSTPGKAKKE